jgi:UDP-N-acetylmuramate dehydrogenase
MNEQTDVPFSSLTTLRVGGPAQRLLVATSDDDVLAAVGDADRAGRPVLVLGDGSNLVVGDSGFAGDVVQVATKGVRVVGQDARGVEVSVAAGTTWDDVVAQAVGDGWGGIEALSGIPGRAGATPIQNVGAYGSEIADVLREVTVLDRASGSVRTLSDDACRFGYRTSRFKSDPGHFVVLAVRLLLTTDGRSAPVRYAELAGTLGVERGERAPVAEVRAAVLSLRRAKGMVLDPADHDTWSVGSFFTNPVLSAAAAAALPADAPRFRQPSGAVKTSAAWLIQQAGMDRGFPGEQAAARLSTAHVLAITNRGSATSADVVALARRVRTAVLDRFGIELVPEPTLVGVTL